MALFIGSIFSKSLETGTSVSVILPDDRAGRPKGGPPVIYLLHGLFDDHTAWVRNTAIARLAEERDFAVVMPEAPRSYFTDMRYGPRYFTYISDELPRLCRSMFGFSASRRRTFAAGVSMGGYGALRCGLKRPDVFSACAGISAAVDIIARAKDYKNRPEIVNAFGAPPSVGVDNDIFALSKAAGTLPEKERPTVFLCCGTEDTKLNENRLLRDKLNLCRIKNEYSEAPGGHDWGYWENALPLVFDFFTKVYEENNI